jgi:sugar phosphate isomerase/epimerase
MLYTLRAECEQDFERTLRRVADLGYEGVELWQLHGHEPQRVRGWLDDVGLAAVGRLELIETLERSLPSLGKEVAVLGTDRVTLAVIEPNREAIGRVARVAKAATEVGLRFGFHNHAPEARPLDASGDTFLDLLRELPPELLWLELDLGWIWHGGGDPVEELEKTKDRCPLVHVKDFFRREGREFAPIGDGAVGYERVIPAAVAAGAEWLLVEQDEIDGDPFETVERSLRAVRRMLPVAA